MCISWCRSFTNISVSISRHLEPKSQLQRVVTQHFTKINRINDRCACRQDRVQSLHQIPSLSRWKQNSAAVSRQPSLKSADRMVMIEILHAICFKRFQLLFFQTISITFDSEMESEQQNVCAYIAYTAVKSFMCSIGSV